MTPTAVAPVSLPAPEAPPVVDKEKTKELSAERGKLKAIDPRDVVINPHYQPRVTPFTEHDVITHALSLIATNGNEVPAIVRPTFTPEGMPSGHEAFEMLSGFRTLAACRLIQSGFTVPGGRKDGVDKVYSPNAGWKMRAVVRVDLEELAAGKSAGEKRLKEVADHNERVNRLALEVAGMGNMGRKDMNAVDVASYIFRYQKAWGCSDADLARKFELTTARIAQLKTINGLPDSVKQQIQKGNLPASIAAVFAKAPPAQQAEIIAHATETNGDVSKAKIAEGLMRVCVTPTDQATIDALLGQRKKKSKKSGGGREQDGGSELQELHAQQNVIESFAGALAQHPKFKLAGEALQAIILEDATPQIAWKKLGDGASWKECFDKSR